MFQLNIQLFASKKGVGSTKNGRDSESKRLELAYSSRRYYCETYLKINWFQKKVLDLTFKIGRFNLLAAKMVKRLLGSV